MALVIQCPSYLRKPSSLTSPLYFQFSRGITIRAQADAEGKTADKAAEEASISADSSAAKSKGLGFGSSGNSTVRREKDKGTKKKRGRERASVIRRTPIEKPAVLSPKEAPDALVDKSNEGAFLLTWLGLGVLIFVEGIVLAASGFLPEEWDKFFVKYLYPSFTPTVVLFVVGTVSYGVYKYLQGEQPKKS